VPELLIPQEPRPHVGSMDIDLALNHVKIREEGYKLIEELLTSRGYYQEKDKQPFIFFREINKLLLDKLPEVLNQDQKMDKIHNLVSSLSGKRIRNIGSRRTSEWVFIEDK
jgi:hypothetical protein